MLPLLRPFLVEHDELVGVLHRELAQQNLVDQREDGRVCPDSQRQRQDGHGGKQRAPAQAAQCIPQVGKDLRHRAIGRIRRPKGLLDAAEHLGARVWRCQFLQLNRMNASRATRHIRTEAKPNSGVVLWLKETVRLLRLVLMAVGEDQKDRTARYGQRGGYDVTDSTGSSRSPMRFLP